MKTTTRFHHRTKEWIHLKTEDSATLEELYETYHIDPEVVAYSLDKNEQAHVDYDRSEKTLVVIYNMPNPQKIDNHYETLPITFILKEDYFFSITNQQTHYLYPKMQKHLAKNPDCSPYEFLFTTLFMISAQFFPYVDEMNARRKVVNERLKEKTTKQNLLSLSDLETGIVYFLSASKQNAVLLEQIRTHTIYKQLTESEREELEDAVIEARQLVEMTQLSSQILQQLSGTYNNVLNNNLNDTMRVLTILSVLLTIPTIITGFFGMNMPLPLEHNGAGWIFTLVLSGILWFVLSFLLRLLMRK